MESIEGAHFDPVFPCTESIGDGFLKVMFLLPRPEGGGGLAGGELGWGRRGLEARRPVPCGAEVLCCSQAAHQCDSCVRTNGFVWLSLVL